MVLYDRNYMLEPTPEEIQQYEEVRMRENPQNGREHGRINLYSQYPEAVRHHRSLFPNNHMDLIDTKNNLNFEAINQEFYDLLNTPSVHEQLILNYIKDNRAFYIPMAILNAGGFMIGNHESYLFPEFSLGQSYRADYLLVGKNSGGYEFVFVEFENPNKNIVLQDGTLGMTFRKGIDQVKKWSRWLEGHYSALQEFWQMNTLKPLPNEFISYKSAAMHFVVVAGRRDDFKTETYNLRKEYRREQHITLLHYDNLYEAACKVAQYYTF